jgi:hypothetical protein
MLADVPTVSTWGLMIMLLALLVLGSVAIVRQRRAET